MLGIFDRTSFAAGRFRFTIDGVLDTAFVKSVDGGQVKGNVVSESTGPTALAFKHVGTVEIEPLTIELGMGFSWTVLESIQKAWRRDYDRLSGEIIHADYDGSSRYEMHYTDALLIETTLPKLDAHSDEAGYITIKLHPQHVELREGDGLPVYSPANLAKQIPWLASNFRMSLDGIDGCEHIVSVESFTIKQNVNQLHVGEDRFPTLEPMSLEFPELTLRIPLVNAGGFRKWYSDYIVNGDIDVRQERSGVISYMTPDLRSELMSVELSRVGIQEFRIDKSEANKAEPKMASIKLYVEEMRLERNPLSLLL